jgi:hypothetical protein
MTERCPHLEYRREGDDRSFDGERAYCTVVEWFVQPMRADVCNARHDLAPCSHCEFYRAHEGIDPTEGLTPSAALDSTADLDG